MKYWWINFVIIVVASIIIVALSKIQRSRLLRNWKAFITSNDNEVVSHQADLQWISSKAMRTAVKFVIQTVAITFALSIPIILFIIFFYEDSIGWQAAILYLCGWFIQMYAMFFTLYTSHEFQIPTALYAKYNLEQSLKCIIVNGSTIGQIIGAGSTFFYLVLRLIWTYAIIDWDASDASLKVQIKNVNDCFFAYAAGTMFYYVFFRMFAQFFKRSAFLAVETLSRTDENGIQEDHPKNPCSFILCIGEGYIKAIQESLEYMALTSFSFTAIYSEYLDISMRDQEYYIDTFLTIFITGLLIKTIVSMISSINTKKICELNTISYKALEKSTLITSLIDNVLILVVIVICSWLLLPDTAVNKKESINMGGQFAVYILSLLFILIMHFIHSYFAFEHHRPGQHLKNAAKISLSVIMLDANNIANIESGLSMIFYAIILLAVHSLVGLIGLCYFLSAMQITLATSKGYDTALALAYSSEILIHGSKLNEEIEKTNIFKKIIYACKCLHSLSGGLQQYLIFTSILILIKSTDDDLDGTEFLGSKSIYGFICAASVLLSGWWLTTLLQNKIHVNFSQKVQDSILKTNFLTTTADPPVQELSQQLGNRSLIMCSILYVVVLLWFLVWMFASIWSSDVGGMMIIILQSLTFLCFLNSVFNYRFGLVLDRIKDFLYLENEKSVIGPSASYVAMIARYMGKIQMEELSHITQIILLTISIGWLITHNFYDVWNYKEFSYEEYINAIAVETVVEVTISSGQHKMIVKQNLMFLYQA